MKRFTLQIRLVIHALAIAVLPILAVADEPADPAIKALLEAHNREREKEHIGPLTLAPKLNEAARIHAADMAKHEKLNHTGSDGSSVADRVKRVGYLYVRVGENIAMGQNSVDEVMSTWMKSPGHRANILANYTELGAARVEDAEGTNYWCVDFGIPMPKLKPDEAAAAVVKQINRERQAGGNVVLKAEPRLAKAAMAISAAMAANDKLDIDDPVKLIDKKALEGRDIHLQLSSNVPTAKEAAKELLGEQPKELDTYREIGVGYAQAKSGTPYWCAIFAKPVGPRRPIRPR